jgi:hypothetical protein
VVSTTPPGLFHDCPVPGCRQPVTDPREPCGTCRELFGDYLARGSASTEPEAYAARLAERDEAVAAAYARQDDGPQPEEPGEPEWKPNQLCWVCSTRRKCRREPDLPSLWICKDCRDRTKEMH